MAANDVAPEPLAATNHPGPLLRLVRSQHPALGRQQDVAERRARVLTRSGVSGQRLVAALHLILEEHAPAPAVTADAAHLACVRCQPDGDVEQQYPCLSAQQALHALEAFLP